MLFRSVVLNATTITEGNAFSGYHRCSMTPELEYSAGFMMKSVEVVKQEPYAVVKLRFRIFSDNPINDVQAVCSIDDEKGSLQWDGFGFPYEKTKSWQEVNLEFHIRPESIRENANIRFYLWNRGRSTFLLDDMSVRFNDAAK